MPTWRAAARACEHASDVVSRIRLLGRDAEPEPGPELHLVVGEAGERPPLDAADPLPLGVRALLADPDAAEAERGRRQQHGVAVAVGGGHGPVEQVAGVTEATA